MESEQIKSKNLTIELFRFFFAIIIVCYHYFSLLLRNTPSTPYFYHGYMADEFFFIVSGYFIANSIIKKSNQESFGWGGELCFKRIKSLAFPYYASWILCFLSLHFSLYKEGKPLLIIDHLKNSIYELLFIDMAGFKSGYYSNGVTWYISALLFCILLFYPCIKKYREKFLLNIAFPLALFSYGILNLNYEELFAPHTILFPFLYKGMLRAIAGINLGFFIYGICYYTTIKEIVKKNGVLFQITQILLILYIFNLMVKPNSPDLFIVCLLFFLLLITFSVETKFENFLQLRCASLAKFLGTISVYIFLCQEILYCNIDFLRLIKNWNTINLIKLCIWVLSVFIISLGLYFINVLFRYLVNIIKNRKQI